MSDNFYQYPTMNTQYTSRSINQPTNQAQIPAIRTISQSGGFQSQAINETLLRWSSIGDGRNDVVIHGQSDVALLKNLRNILLGLQSQFTSGGPKVTFTGDKKDDFNKRLILLEGQIQGLLKRKIEYTSRDQNGGTRVMDYTGILNQKQTQIVELEKKINNLQERLRRANARQLQLENNIAQLYSDLKRKQQIIIAKNDVILAEVATSNALRQSLNRVRKNIDTNKSRIGDLERTILDAVTFPDIGSFEIKGDVLTKDGAASRSKGFQNLPQNQKTKTQLIQLFREFQRYNNQDGITDNDTERILQGFLVGFNGSRIKQSVDLSIARRKQQDDYNRIKQQFGVAVGIFQSTLERIRKQNPNNRVDVDSRIFEILKDHKIAIYKTAGDVVHLQRFSERTVQVPVQDARTKHLIHLLAVQMKKFCGKYPKLLDQMDGRLTQFFQQQLIDIIQVDQVDRLVQIVKYVPQVVKVQNVYAYSSEKSRKIEFHLRVLVKALLQQVEKIRRRTGVVLQIDQGIIGMINQQIMGVVDVDDILKVFRVVPKIVEVEKIVEKIVDRIVQVPQIVVVQKIIQKIIEVEKIKQVQRIVNVPLEVPTIVSNIVEKVVPIQRIVERVVQVPQIVQRIVEVIKEVPKIQIVERFEERQVEVQKIIQVQKVVNHIETRIQQVEVVVEKVVPTERVIEIIRQVPVIVQKIVDRVVQIPKVIEIEKIVQIIVPQIQYRNAKQIQNHIQVRHNIVDRIIQKPVPIIQTVQRIVQVPQIVEKIITIERIVQQIKQVQVIVEKIVLQDRIIQVVRQVKIPVQIIREVPRQIQKIVQIPIIHERIVTVQQIIEKPVIQRIQNTIIKQVYLRDPIIIRQPKTIEVEKIVNHYIDVPKPIKYIEQKIVEVVKYVDRIKQIKVPVEKVIEKMVQVPKVVEVERIVEKIVVVPRVVQKVVEVPQIVERIVPKIIIQEKIRQVERIVQVPMIQDKIVEIDVPQNFYIQVPQIVEKIVDKLVEVPRYEEKIINNQVIIEKVIQVIKEIPRNIQVEKIVHLTLETPKVIEIDRQIIVPIEVPIPVEKIVEKIIPVTQIIEKPFQVPQVIEKVVTIREQVVQIKQIARVEQKIVNNVQYRQIIKEVPYITERIKEVEKVVEKIVPVQSIVQQIVTAQQIVEKIVEKTITIPKIYEVERRNDIVIEIPKIVEIEKIIPQIINVNRYIQNIVEKIVEVPIIVQQIKQVVRENEKIVQVRNQYETIKQVESIVQKAVIVEKFKEVVRNINHIEKVLQIIDRFQQTPVEVLVQEEKLIEVPYILEKIVEKIVVMPQIVQVLKYVHEVTEKEELGVAVGADVGVYEQRLKVLSKDIKVTFDLLLTELRKLIKNNPNLRAQIELIEKFLIQFEEYLLYPKIFSVPKEIIVQKVVEKDRIVSVPTQDERSIKMELTLSLLVQKLILQVKRLRRDNPNLNLQLEDDVKLIFFTELDQGTNLISGDFNLKLKSFSDSVYRKFQSLGNWSVDHQMMLNSFLQERFLMANLIKHANLEIEKTKTISSKRDESLKRYQSEIGVLEGYIGKIRSNIMQGGLTTQQGSILTNIFKQFDIYSTTRVIGQPVRILDDLAISDARIQSLIRQKDVEILRLRDRIFSIQKSRIGGSSSQSSNKIIEILRSQNLKLKNSLSELQAQVSSTQLVAGYKHEIIQLQQRNLYLQQTISTLKSDLANYKKEHQVGIKIYESNVKDSGVTGLDRTSQASSYIPTSPNSGIKMVESSYRGTGDSNYKGVDSSSAQRSREPTYGSSLIDSTSGVKQEASYGTKTEQKDQPFRSTFASDNRSSYDPRISTSTLDQGGNLNTTTSRYGTGTGAGYSSPQSGSSYSSQSGSSIASVIPTSSYTGQTGLGQTSATYSQQQGANLSSGYSSASSTIRPGTYQGATGTTRQTGTIGISGTTGITGSGTYQGATGTTGYTGNAGISGTTGTTGSGIQGGARYGTYSSTYNRPGQGK